VIGIPIELRLDDAQERALPVFNDAERRVIEGVPELRPFAALTVAQVKGLLWALGEYAARPHFAARWTRGSSSVCTHPDALRRHDLLCRFWVARHGSWRRPGEPDNDLDDVVVPLPDSARLAFGEATRQRVSLFKYACGLEFLTVNELCVLLGRLVRYVAVAQPMPEADCIPREGPARMMHAHNRLLAFPRQLFTEEEMATAVKTLVRNLWQRSRSGRALLTEPLPPIAE
jgi:hypothetical protein